MSSVLNTTIHKGDSVRVRLHNGETVLRRVWGAASDVVYICTDRVFEALNAGSEAPQPIGFPLSEIEMTEGNV